MNWPYLILVVAVMSITANGFLIWMLRDKHMMDEPLIDELRGANEVLRGENKQLYERIETMAASIPHIRLVKGEEDEYEAESTLEEKDEEGNVIGHKGAGVV